MSVKIKSLPKATKHLKNTVIPSRHKHDVGHYTEDQLINIGYEIDKTAHVDMTIATIPVEVRTRDINSKSAQSIGAMTICDIVNTPYEQSAICQRFQTIFKAYHDGEHYVDVKVRDFSDPKIQELAKVSYEMGRAIIASTPIDELPSYIRGKYPDGSQTPGYFERKGMTNSYQFRFGDGWMKKIEGISQRTEILNKFFDWS